MYVEVFMTAAATRPEGVTPKELLQACKKLAKKHCWPRVRAYWEMLADLRYGAKNNEATTVAFAEACCVMMAHPTANEEKKALLGSIIREVAGTFIISKDIDTAFREALNFHGKP